MIKNIIFMIKNAKKSQMTTNKLIVISLAILLLLVMLILYAKWSPNPDNVAKRFTDAVKIGPFG